MLSYDHSDIAMKTFHVLAAACGLLVVAAGPALAATADVRAEVVFDHPEKFTDAKDEFIPTEVGSTALLNNLRDYLLREARLYVPEGWKLTIVFTDVDLAGDFEPWRGAQWADVRVIKSIYPPHFKFSFTLADATGRVIRQGKEDLLDQEFEMRLTLDHEDPLRYDKVVLQDWMRRQMRSVRPAPAAQ